MRHRNEEDDFVVKSTGRQRVVFVAIIFVRSNALAVSFCHFSCFLFPSCVATLNPTTEVNPKHFFFVFPLSLLLLLLLGIQLDSSSHLCFCSSRCEGWFRRDDGGRSVSSGALTERERERTYYYIRTRILAKIKRSFYSYFSHL